MITLKDITTKCWILALFIRSDGERFLLGDGMYDFKDSQQHFQANEFANDVIEVQGNDGALLAGQVRRATAQSFDGFIGDATVSKSRIEEARRDFFEFFRKNYYYEVVYIFQDGSAIKRQRGYIVDAPEVQELWQIHPKYHVALNFEDVNYYVYAELADGTELFGKSVDLTIAGGTFGGLVWSAGNKNLLNTNVSVSGAITAGSTQNSLNGDQGAITSGWIECEPNTSYTISWKAGSIPDGNRRTRWQTKSVDGSIAYAGQNTNTITTGADTVFLRVYYFYNDSGNGAAVDPASITGVQLEKGSSATTYEDYVAPGVIWEAHGKNYFDRSKYEEAFSTTGQVATPILSGLRVSNTQAGAYRWCAIPVVSTSDLLGKTITASANYQVSGDNDVYLQLYFVNKKTGALGPNFGGATIQQTNTTVSLTASVPDTIPSGMDAIAVVLYATKTVSAPAGTYVDYTNIQVEIGSSVTTYEPFTHGAVWEKGSGGSSTNTIAVDSLDKVAPIWKVSGPITNPTLENITTNTSITFAGSLAAGQTLTINSNNMTADVDGTNVLSLISGNWLELSPGTNRLVFSASAAEVEGSKLEWQEIVG